MARNHAPFPLPIGGGEPVALYRPDAEEVRSTVSKEGPEGGGNATELPLPPGRGDAWRRAPSPDPSFPPGAKYGKGS